MKDDAAKRVSDAGAAGATVPSSPEPADPSLDGLLGRCRMGIDRDQSALEDAQARVKSLQSRIRESRAIERFLAETAMMQREGNVSEALRGIRASARVVSSIADREPQAGDQVRAVERVLEDRVVADFAELVRSFPRGAKEAGLPLDATSRHPNYTVADRLIEVQFDKRRLETRITTPGGRRTTIGTDVPVVVDRVRTDLARLTERELDQDRFLASLEQAYTAAAKKAADARGRDGAVPLKSVIDALAEDKGFAIDEFIVDLSRLVRTERQGSRIRLDHTRDASSGVLLWQLEDRGYYGYIRVE